MPGAASPGRRQPVRGVASQNNSNTGNGTSPRRSTCDNLNHPVSSASLPWETPIRRAAATASVGISRDDGHHHQQSSSLDADRNDSHGRHGQQQQAVVRDVSGRRPFSSGFPAPAIAVPIFGGARQALEFPDSPPSTPPRLPLHTPRLLDDLAIDPMSTARIENAQAEEEEDKDVAIRTPVTQMSLSHQHNLLAEATNVILNPAIRLRQQQQWQHQQLQSQGQAIHKAQPVAMRGGGVGLMPATPEMSPDQEVQHYAVKSAKAFFHRVFKDFDESARVEDAGVELVCPGWSGAVLKTGSTSSADAAAGQGSTSYSSTTSSSSGSSSSGSKRTLYVVMPTLLDQSQLREQVLALLDAAGEKLGCETVILCLDRRMRDFAVVLHGMCYVGGQVVSVGSGSGSGDKQGESSGGSWHTASSADVISGCAPRDGLVLVGVEL